VSTAGVTQAPPDSPAVAAVHAQRIPVLASRREIRKGATVTWTRAIPPAAADEALRSINERIRAHSTARRIANVWQALAPDPAALDSVFTLVRTLMDQPAPLRAAQAEEIAVVVSATNGCGYCVAHHGPKLATALANEGLARAVARDYRQADLPARDRVLLDFAVALSCEPSERTEEDIERVREYGFDDDAILKATAITALFNLLNRVVSALGVTLEDGVEEWEFGAQK
jgi:uncharacterized peroxidase-related enzyme